MTNISVVQTKSKGRRPTLSDSAPITGSQKRFDAPTQRVTIRLSMLARCYFNFRQYDEGISTITRAISREPEESFYFYLLGYGHYQKDNAFEATANLHKAIQLNPDYAQAYVNRGSVYVELDDLSQARYDFTRAIEINPQTAQAFNDRAIVYYQLKEYAKARDDVQTATSLGYAVNADFASAVSKAGGDKKEIDK